MFNPKRSKRFLKEYANFRKTNPAKACDVDKLMEAILTEPRTGVGRPERLKHKVNEMWSRRIDKKNRLVYTIGDDTIYFESCEGHYNNH